MLVRNRERKLDEYSYFVDILQKLQQFMSLHNRAIWYTPGITVGFVLLKINITTKAITVGINAARVELICEIINCPPPWIKEIINTARNPFLMASALPYNHQIAKPDIILNIHIKIVAHNAVCNNMSGLSLRLV